GSFGLVATTLAGSVIGLASNFTEYAKSLKSLTLLAPELNLSARALYNMKQAADSIGLPGMISGMQELQHHLNMMTQDRDLSLLVQFNEVELHGQLMAAAKAKDTEGALRAIVNRVKVLIEKRPEYASYITAWAGFAGSAGQF